MVVRKVGKYEVGRTIGEGTFTKHCPFSTLIASQILPLLNTTCSAKDVNHGELCKAPLQFICLNLQQNGKLLPKQKVKVIRGTNLAVQDMMTSDPNVILTLGKQCLLLLRCMLGCMCAWIRKLGLLLLCSVFFARFNPPCLLAVLLTLQAQRLRWTNYLRPDLKRGLLSEYEEKICGMTSWSVLEHTKGLLMFLKWFLTVCFVSLLFSDDINDEFCDATFGPLIHDLIAREGPFLEIACILIAGPFLEIACILIAGLTFILWLIVVVSSIVLAVFMNILIGLYASIVVYQVSAGAPAETFSSQVLQAKGPRVESYKPSFEIPFFLWKQSAYKTKVQGLSKIAKGRRFKSLVWFDSLRLYDVTVDD
ncbi:hypothetical protein DVH24_034759 [Malus domestica]|uniref:Uncharacterized protein n=1 Tax=Malus domestica TaxID=3750 RepID=A0A498IWS1_MALDO|nr:hypothetical protein DVH24_034759 [Malus domestica]